MTADGSLLRSIGGGVRFSESNFLTTSQPYMESLHGDGESPKMATALTTHQCINHGPRMLTAFRNDNEMTKTLGTNRLSLFCAFMASASSSFQPSHWQQCSNQQDDDAVWVEYISMASIEDAHLIDGWTKITDVTLVFVALFSGVLTAFIVQTSKDFRPHPQDVTNQLLIAIYRHQVNPFTAPIDFEEFFKLDDSKLKRIVYLNSLLYTSLAISVAVGAVAMAAKLWIIRYKHAVNTSGPPHLRAKRRQEVYDGSITWGLERCIEALPVMALISEVLFALFIFSSISEDNKKLGYVVGIIFHLGLSFVLITSSTAAFNSTSPFRSPFSDFVNFVFRIFPAQTYLGPNPELQKKIGIRPRMIAIVLASVLILVVTGYLASEQIAAGIPLIYFPYAAIFALAREEIEMDIRPRLYNLPKWSFFTASILFITCALAFYFSNNRTLFTIFYLLICILLGVLGFVIIKTSRIKPRTADADAISWLLSTSLSQNPDWFKKAVQVAEGSSNLRARLLKALFPLLVPLIITSNRKKDDEQTYLNCLADLVDFEPYTVAFWRNHASLEHPSLPPELRERLEALLRIECPHRNQNTRKRWIDDTEHCASDAAEHILRVLGKNDVKHKEPTMENV